MVNTNPVWGGSKIANLNIAEMLSKDNEVIVNDEYQSSAEWTYSFQLDTYEWHKKNDNKGFILYIMQNIKPDIIIWGTIQMLPYYYHAVSVLNKKRIKQIAIYHSLSLNNTLKGKLIDFLISRISVKMSELVFVSQYTANSWRKFRTIQKISHKVKVIYNPIKIQPQAKSVARNEKKERTLGFVGRLSPEKQPELFCMLAMRDRTNQYVVWGDGLLFNSLKAKYGDVVSFMGYQANAEVIYSNMDILVMTSLFENCPMAILEAKQRGIPCIAPNVGGIGEILNDNEGCLYPLFDIEYILSQVDNILRAYEKYSMNCILSANAFSYEHISEQWKTIL
jgi:glycosyltransferase involved in cell wall biosynthesis